VQRRPGRCAVTFGQDAQNDESGIRAADGGFLLDARRTVLRQQARAGRCQPGVALAAARHYHDARSEPDRGLPVWRDFSEPARPTWRRKAGPGGTTDSARHTSESRLLAALRRPRICLLL